LQRREIHVERVRIDDAFASVHPDHLTHQELALRPEAKPTARFRRRLAHRRAAEVSLASMG
jgi:hypothetical protein